MKLKTTGRTTAADTAQKTDRVLPDPDILAYNLSSGSASFPRHRSKHWSGVMRLRSRCVHQSSTSIDQYLQHSAQSALGLQSCLLTNRPSNRRRSASCEAQALFKIRTTSYGGQRSSSWPGYSTSSLSWLSPSAKPLSLSLLARSRGTTLTIKGESNDWMSFSYMSIGTSIQTLSLSSESHLASIRHARELHALWPLRASSISESVHDEGYLNKLSCSGINNKYCIPGVTKHPDPNLSLLAVYWPGGGNITKRSTYAHTLHGPPD